MLFIKKLFIKKEIRLFWSKTDQKKGLINFGDALNPLLVEKLSSKKVLPANLRDCELIAIGSILERAEQIANEEKRSFQVWGSGFIQEGDNFKQSRLKFAAVRGKLTYDRIPNDEVALGDPGLLADILIPKAYIKKKYKFAIIPHYVDMGSPALNQITNYLDNSIILNVFDNPLDIIKKISESEIVLSSSLHGLIVADSLNIPNCRLILSDKIIGGSYKFNDYYSAFNMSHPSLIDLRLKIALTEKQIIERIEDYERPNITTIKKKLIKSFPF